jgi:protein-tyrosine phosphatase
MFNFFKKHLVDDGLPYRLPFFTDMHSHILFGIDDGSPNIKTSLQLIKNLQKLGIKKTIATPHIIGDLYRNTPQIINEKLLEVQIACKKRGINIDISAAAEYMLDDYFIGLLQKKERLLTLQGNYILTEISYSVAPQNLPEILQQIIEKGYQPILAHPERYIFYQNKMDNFFILKEMGFHLQVNLLSLTGYYGPGACKCAKFILEKNLAPFIGTDVHHQKHIDTIKNPEHKMVFEKYIGNKIFNEFN